MLHVAEICSVQRGKGEEAEGGLGPGYRELGADALGEMQTSVFLSR